MSQGHVSSNGTIVDSIQASLRLDDVGGGVTYIGEAAAGSLTSAAVWRVKRLTEVGTDLTIEWAAGNTSFDKIWDNRASMGYS